MTIPFTYAYFYRSMKNWLPEKQRPLILAAIGSLLVLAFFFRLGFMELRGEEARRALVAMEMLSQGSYWVPLLHGLPYINKPPLYQWVLMLFFSGPFNVSEWLLRLPGVLSAFATAGMIYWTGRHWLSRPQALMAGLIYLTGADLLFFGFVYAGEIDPFYAFITFSQMAILLLVFTGKRPSRWLWLSFLLAAMGILTKGLPSIVHQVISFMTLLFLTRKWRFLWDPNFIGGVMLMLLIPVSYFIVYAQWEDPWNYLVNLYWESVKKSGAVSSPAEVLFHFFEFPFQFIWLLFPWSFSLILLFRKRVRKVWWIGSEQKVVLILLLVNLVIYWLSPDTRNRYLYPFLPWLALLIVPVLSSLDRRYFLIPLFTILSLRVIYNVAVMPWHQQHFEGRDAVSKVIDITGDEPIRYYGGWDTLKYDIKFPLLGAYKAERKVPTQIPYKVPFYIMAQNGHYLKFDTLIQPDTWYISLRENWLHDTASIRYELPVIWNDSPVVLARNEGAK